MPRNEHIFDRFEVAVNQDGSEVMSGSYGNACTVWNPHNAKVLSNFEAGCAPRATHRSLSGPPPGARLDTRVLSLAWHPTERLVACSSDNTLYLHNVRR